MKTPHTPEAIGSADWNFDLIPDQHLIACCYWEYARESTFLREFKSRCVEANLQTKPLAEAFDTCGKDAQRVLAIGLVANSFLLGFTIEPDNPKNRAASPKPDPQAPVTGNFPAPWQTLSAAERDYRAGFAADVSPVEGQPFQRATGPDAINALTFYTSGIAPAVPQPGPAPALLTDALERQIARLNALATQALSAHAAAGEKPAQHAALPPGATDSTSAPPAPSLHRLDTPGGTADEIALVQIQWGSFTDDEIIDSFRAWVKANRPASIRLVRLRGYKLEDWRANLNHLAVTRLLRRFSALELLDPKADRVPGLWKSKQFSSPDWRDAVKWRKARHESRAIFHQLFPFLPPADDPVSWPTAHPEDR